MAVATLRRQRLGAATTVAIYRLGAFGARIAPTTLRRGVARALGITLPHVMRTRRATVERHMRRARPDATEREVRRAVRSAFESYARYYIDGFALPSLSSRTVADAFRVDGFEQVREGIEKGCGVILALPHLGGWEWAGRWVADQGLPITVVVEPLQPPELFEWFADLRQRLGMTVVPLGPQAAPALMRALRNNEVVCLLCDRDIGAAGVQVEFFGERTRLPAGPATLGLRTGAPVLPVAVYFKPRGNQHHAVVRPPLPADRRDGFASDVARMTQDLANELQVLISQAPEQWHLFQPNWPSDPGFRG